MENKKQHHNINQILNLIKDRRWKEVRFQLNNLLPADKSTVYESLETEQQQEFLPHTNPADVADIIEQIEDQDAAILAESLDPDVLVQVLNQMAPDEAANLLGDIDQDLSRQTLDQLTDVDMVRPLLRYPDDTAGGLMTSDYDVYPENTSAAQILREMRSQPPRDEEIPYVYAVDEHGQLTGVIRLADLFRAHPGEPLRTIAKTQVVSITADQDQELAARLLNRYDLMALPVVDGEGRLVGLVTEREIIHAIIEKRGPNGDAEAVAA